MAGTCRIEHPLRDRGPNSGDCHRWDRRSASPGEAFGARSINDRLGLLKVHLPYHESDHVLNIDYNLLAGGTRLEHLELLRNDEGYLDALGARRIPDPTTAGDFCRRFDAERINTLQEIFNDTRVRIWRQQPEDFFREAVLDADGTMVETTGQCKEEMDINYKNQWGCHPLMLSLANTGEPLHVVNRPGNRLSHEQVATTFEQGDRPVPAGWVPPDSSARRHGLAGTPSPGMKKSDCSCGWSSRRSGGPSWPSQRRS